MNLNFPDGTNDLITISEKSNFSFSELIPVVHKLLENGLIRR